MTFRNHVSNDSYKRLFGIDLDTVNDEVTDILNIVEYILFEHYLPNHKPLYSKIPFLHPHLIPKSARRIISKWIKRNKNRTGNHQSHQFPNFPFDLTVDVLMNLLREQFGTGKKPVPFWPAEKKAAIVLTHDVDNDYLFKNRDLLDTFLDVEESFGFRSAWFFVVRKYRISHKILEELNDRGHEIGFHGDNHDLRLPFLKPVKIKKRLDKCIPFFNRYGVKGGRSPVFLRSPYYLDTLQHYLEYDTSFHDSTIGPLSGLHEGCCSCFPFFIDSLLEIPTTIPEDFLLRMRGHSWKEVFDIQIKKADMIKRMNGVIHVLTHPDPLLSANRDGISLYTQFLKRISSDSDIWRALPGELNNHWRRRNKVIMHQAKKEIETCTDPKCKTKNPSAAMR